MVKRCKKSKESTNDTYSNTSKRVHKWSDFMDKFLQYMVEIYNENSVWPLFERLTNIPINEAKQRQEYLNKFKSKRIPFTEEEDAQILELYKIHGTKWSKIAKKMKSRTRKQIRERFINILDENYSKSPFTLDEDLQIFQLFKQHGTKWAFISQSFPHRTTDKIRVRYHSHIKKRSDFFNSLLKSKCK